MSRNTRQGKGAVTYSKNKIASPKDYVKKKNYDKVVFFYTLNMMLIF
jgi:hypothetical protein